MQLFRVELPARAFPAAASPVISGVHIHCGEPFGAVGGGQPQQPDRHCLWCLKQSRALVAGMDPNLDGRSWPVDLSDHLAPMACPSNGARAAEVMPSQAWQR